MTRLERLFSRRAVARRRRVRGPIVAGERLEPRALLAVSVPPSITADTVEIDDNLVVADGGGTIWATGGPTAGGYVQIFGNSRGRIDGTPGQLDEDLTLRADTYITVTGAIGGIQRLDDLTLTSDTAQPVNLQQAVSLTGDLLVTKAGTFTIGSTVDIDGDLTITEATSVTFSGNVTVDGDLTIVSATNVTFGGMLTVGGTLTIVDASGTTRFLGDVQVKDAAITSTTLVQVLANFTSVGAAGVDGDVTFRTDQINFVTAAIETSATSGAGPSATLTVAPRTLSRDLTIASPPGIPSGLNITDAALFAIQPGWKRVVFGDETAGTGGVLIGSIGSQYGGFSQILNTTTIVGGTIDVVQPVDVTTLADYLDLVARGTGSGDGRITISAPINQTEGERNDWVRLTSAGTIQIDAAIWAGQTVSLTTTAGGAISQASSDAAITSSQLAIVADGGVTLPDFGNAILLLAAETTNDDLFLREDSGYAISQVTTIDDGRAVQQTVTVTGIKAGTGTVRLLTVTPQEPASTVTQSQPILAGGLGLEGVGTHWSLGLASNDIATLAANTGMITFRDTDDLTIGTVAAVASRGQLDGIVVQQSVDVTAGTTLTITAAGDIVSAASSDTAVNLSAPSGILTAGNVETSGGDLNYNHAVTLTGDVVLDLENGPARGLVTFADAVDGTTSGQESLTIGGDLDASGSIGSAMPLESLSVSGNSTLAGGITLRTAGNQTYFGGFQSTGTITIQAGTGSTVEVLGDVSLGGLITATADAAAYDVSLTGSSVSVTNAVTFANTGTTTLGDSDTDSLAFIGGLTSTAPNLTQLAGTVATTDAAVTFGDVELLAGTTVSSGSGNAGFNGSVDGGSSLSVNSTGNTTFSAPVGGTTPLVSLTTNAGGTTEINGGAIATSGVAGQVFNDVVLLGANTALDAAAGAITFATTLDGAKTLALNTTGITRFDGAVGGTTPLVSLATNSGGTTEINGGSITTSGVAGQVFNDAVTLGANAFLDAAAGAITFATTLDGAYVLTADTTGVTRFDGVVGGTTSLVSLSTNAGGTTEINGGSIATSDSAGQVYGDAVELGAETTLEAGSGAITFLSTVNGPFALSANTQGLTTFGGAVGNTTPLAALVTDAGGTTRISGGSVTTAAPVLVGGGDVGALVESGQFYDDAVELGADATLTAGGVGLVPTVVVGGDAIVFAQTVDGAYALVVNTAGSTTFAGAVGGTTPLASLTTDAGGSTFVQGRLVRTTGVQTYADLLEFDDVPGVTPPAVVMPTAVDQDPFDLQVLLPEEDGEAADLESSVMPAPQTLLEGATVSLLEGLDGGGHRLVIDGDAVFGDQPGSTLDTGAPVDPVANLESLTVTGATTVNSTSVTTEMLQTYQGGVTLGSDVVFFGSGQRFDSTIAGPGRTLNLLASSEGITLGGDVGTAAAPLGPIQGLAFAGTIQIDAAVYSTGPVVFISLLGSVDGGPNNAIHAPGSWVGVSGLTGVGVTNPIAVEAAEVGAVSMGGDVRLRGIGDLVVGDPGILASGTLDLDASGEIRVPGGEVIQVQQGVTATKPIRWGLVGTADAGAGSLRDVIAQANATGVAGIVEFGDAPATFVLGSQLPEITTSLVLDGGGQVTISGNRRVANGLTFVPGSTGSELRGVSLAGFRNYGIRLLGATGVTIDDVRVTSLNTWQSMGLYATGDLAGTTILASRFSGGLRGALLVNARNLAFGAIGRGNTFVGNRSVPGSRFAGTGIRAQGDSTGTVVEGNTFTQNYYGFAFINARNLRLADNRFTRNTIAAIFVEGNNAGSVAVGNEFGRGSQRNARNIFRARGGRGV